LLRCTSQDVDFRFDPCLEANYNMNNKLLGKTTMAHAEYYQALANEQYSSRKQRSGTLVLLNNCLATDIMRQQHVGGAIVSTNANSCYDCIFHPVLSLSLQQLEVPSAPLRSTIHTLQNLRHNIKTIYRVSTQAYSSRDLPLQGVVQGHSTAPTGWVAVSSPLIQMLWSKGFGFTHKSTLSNEKVKIACFAFVDDTDLIQSRTLVESDEHFLSKVQQLVHTWVSETSCNSWVVYPIDHREQIPFHEQ